MYENVLSVIRDPNRVFVWWIKREEGGLRKTSWRRKGWSWVIRDGQKGEKKPRRRSILSKGKAMRGSKTCSGVMQVWVEVRSRMMGFGDERRSQVVESVLCQAALLDEWAWRNREPSEGLN